METPVAYACNAPSHRVGEGGGPDKLTVHDGQWAFCPFDIKAEGHEWTRAPGLTMTMLRSGALVREKDAVKDRDPVR